MSKGSPVGILSILLALPPPAAVLCAQLSHVHGLGLALPGCAHSEVQVLPCPRT